jgi:hypothetical protein
MEGLWIEHFKKMALNQLQNMDVFELDQCGGGSADVEIISPVESVAVQVINRVKREKKQARSKSTSGGSIKCNHKSSENRR